MQRRRKSQRLASTLDALEKDFQVKQVVDSFEDDAIARKTLDEYWGENVGGDDEKILLLGQDEQQKQSVANVMQGQPGVEQFGSEATGDTSEVRDLGSDYGVDFDGDDDLEDSIRDVPNRDEKIRLTIAKLQRIANYLEKNGHTKLAYRIDVVCNNLEKYHLNK